MITYGGPELLLLFVIFLVTPVLYRKYLHKLERKVRIISISILWLFTFFVGYTDVIYISLKARKLCREEAGLQVYKIMRTDRVLSPISEAENWLKYGFKFVESWEKEKKVRLSFKDGKITKEDIEYFTVKYQGKTFYKPLNIPIIEQKETLFVFNSAIRPLDEIISANELLGEIISYSVYPGWLDRRLLGLLGFTWIPPRCDGDFFPQRGKSTIYTNDLIKAVIKPM